MTNTRNVSSGLVEENKELNKAGYYYRVEDCTDFEDGGYNYVIECWELFFDGTLHYSYEKLSSCMIDYDYGFDGTFDKAKYQDYVNQMKEHREDWMKEIKVNDDWD